MYESRLYFTNGIVSYELDALNGEPLAFVREDRADNARKNHFLKVTDILDGEIFVDGKALHLNIPRYAQIRLDPDLKPSISIEQKEKEARAEIFYPYLVANGEKVAVSAHVTISLLPGDCRTRWNLKLDNQSGCEITQLSFPELGGLWLGDDWEENVLVMPRVSGSKIPNPTKTISAPPVRITWKWQEYLHNYILTNRSGVKDDREVYTFRCPYTGGGSMLWLDLYSKAENSGIYMTCYNPEFELKDVHVTSCGEYYPGVGLGVLHHPCLKEGQWESGECVVAFHEGDWHWAADEYRTMRETIDRPVLTSPAVPEWFRVSTGLAAHYDFRYQCGGVVHRFSDIPDLYRRTQKEGLDHLFIAGWHEDGFDFGFPHYAPDPALGGSEGLKKALDEVHEMGGHVTFYVNSRLCNVAFEDQKERIEKSAVKRHDGSLRIENYGAGDVKFASLCMNEPEWRGYFAGAIRHLLQDVGADGIYLDQLAMTLGMTCYHEGHEEHRGHPAAWNQGYEKLLHTLRTENPGKAIFYEGCCDIFGKGVSAQLISTLRQVGEGVTPEIYRYTFPNEVLLDMENPRRHSGMRPEHVARKSTFYLYRGFVCGLYFWVYDLEGDNTFTRDPEQEARLWNATRLKKIWLEKFGLGTFRDQIGLLNLGENDLVKKYDLPDHSILIPAAKEGGLSGEVSLHWLKRKTPEITVYTANHPEGVQIEGRMGNGSVSIPLPEEELCLIHIQ